MVVVKISGGQKNKEQRFSYRRVKGKIEDRKEGRKEGRGNAGRGRDTNCQEQIPLSAMSQIIHDQSKVCTCTLISWYFFHVMTINTEGIKTKNKHIWNMYEIYIIF